jgi:hypothetical protein
MDAAHGDQFHHGTDLELTQVHWITGRQKGGTGDVFDPDRTDSGFFSGFCPGGFFFAFLPIYGDAFAPNRVRILIALVVALLFAPLVEVSPSVFPQTLWQLLGFLWPEALLGLSLGFVGRLFFAAVQFAGSVMGHELGFQMADVIDPTQQARIPVLGQMLFIGSLLVFLGSTAIIFSFRRWRNRSGLRRWGSWEPPRPWRIFSQSATPHVCHCGQTEFADHCGHLCGQCGDGDVGASGAVHQHFCGAFSPCHSSGLFGVESHLGILRASGDQPVGSRAG